MEGITKDLKCSSSSGEETVSQVLLPHPPSESQTHCALGAWCVGRQRRRGKGPGRPQGTRARSLLRPRP